MSLLRKHVIILGLDGVPLVAFRKLIDMGSMPFVKHIVGKGFLAEHIVDLPFTLASWTSISTGCGPGKHGIFDFLKPEPNAEPSVVTKSSLERPTIGEIVAMMGLNSVMIGVPMTYPPIVRSRIKVVSSWLEPKLMAYPSDELDTVKRILSKGGKGPTKVHNIGDYLEDLVDNISRRSELIEYYLQKHNWSLLFTVFPEPDWAFHVAFGELISNGKFMAKLTKLFSVIDKTIKNIVEYAPENTLLIISSDHGFMVAKKSLCGNVMLLRMGLLKSTAQKLSAKAKLAHWIAKIMPSRVKHWLKYRLLVTPIGKDIVKPFAFHGLPIDYVNSEAYFTISYNIYTNPRLPSKRRDELRQKIMLMLQKYRYMFNIIEYGDKYFHGPYVSRAPDIVVIPREGYNVSTRLIYTDIIEEGKWYVHSSHGMLMLHTIDSDGEFIKKDKIKNVDIAPTVLAWLGLPLDPDMDGTPLVKISKSRYRKYGSIYRALKAVFLRRKLSSMF